MSGTASAVIDASSARRALEARPLALGEIEPEAHRVGNGQDVREQDRRIERKAIQRLQRHLGRERRILGAARESFPPSPVSRCTRADTGPPGASARPACTAWARGAGRAGRCRWRTISASCSSWVQEEKPRRVVRRGSHRKAIAISGAARSLPSGTRRPRARIGGPRGSPTPRATGRAACRRRRRPCRPTSGNRRCSPRRSDAGRA